MPRIVRYTHQMGCPLFLPWKTRSLLIIFNVLLFHYTLSIDIQTARRMTVSSLPCRHTSLPHTWSPCLYNSTGDLIFPRPLLCALMDADAGCSALLHFLSLGRRFGNSEQQGLASRFLFADQLPFSCPSGSEIGSVCTTSDFFEPVRLIGPPTSTHSWPSTGLPIVFCEMGTGSTAIDAGVSPGLCTMDGRI